MRTFGKDSPEFMEFKVEGDKKTYRLPLAGSIKAEFNVRLFEAGRADEADREYLTQRLILDMFRFYLGDEFADAVDADTMLAIWNAWLEEGRKANQDAGE